ncbi:hypothetical protein DM02DRAFT_220969 [Periconia macrospinosa]|uniref:DUF3176 domain-containing protein n=1 Tax=Periconia macrospinosa TaxID=97972 RepID=A0A2V1D7M3_9PLEO|nr:hypothetical protein DM02DRAFT_220969 [Periconia macrospinosa]
MFLNLSMNYAVAFDDHYHLIHSTIIMSKAQKPQQWPPYPHIPIYLETSDNIGTTRSYRSISPIPPSPGIQPQSSSIHYLAAASTQFTNISRIPTNISPISPATQFTNLSPIWPIPEPLPAPPPEIVQKDSRRPALRFLPTAKPRVQLGHISDKTCGLPKHNSLPQPSRKSKLGLGIQDIPSPTSFSPQDPERGNRDSNIAQRIEEKIWRYNLSGNVAKRWLLEIISWLISAICMGAIIGVLIAFRNKPLPKLPYGLTLNAYIAIMSKISGAALLLPVSEALGQLKWSWFQADSKKMWDFEIFDNASRGPWGSFLLLVRTKGKALAAIGAVITLFALALDPFFQQVVDFPERWILSGTSQIPRMVYYAPKYDKEYKAGIELSQKDPALQTIAEPFLYGNGTDPIPFGNGTRADIPLSCPTGNCTWPTYNTLGMCSKCVAMPKLLSYSCRNTTLDWIANISSYKAERSQSGLMCGYFFNVPGREPILMSGYRVNSNGTKGEVLLSRVLPFVSPPERVPLMNVSSINFGNIRNPIVNALIAGASNDRESVYKGEAPIVHECIVSWCVKTITSRYYQATYEEEVTETFFNTTQGPYPWKTVDVSSPGFNGTTIFYGENINIEAPGINNSRSEVYGTSNLTASITTLTFDDVFPSFVTSQNSSAEIFMRYRTYQSGPYSRQIAKNPWASPSNVTAHIERLAKALTNAVRSSNSNVMVEGHAFNSENYVLVRWQWLSLPLGLLVLSALFLAATIIKTSKERERVGIWKTSALATLLYGLPDHYQERIANRSSGGTPRAKAKELKVKLLPKKGWRVSGNLFSPVTPNPDIKQNSPPPGWI